MTLAIAIVGAVSGVTSLLWQLWSFRLSGSRVSVELVQAWLGPSGAVVGTPGSFKEDVPPAEDLVLQCWGIQVRNRGRLPTSIASCSLEVGAASAFATPSLYNNPQLPHTLDPEHEATWFVGRAEATAVAGALVKRDGVIRGTARLGSGKAVASRNTVPLP
jgi:hypothetical protein